MSCCFLLEYGMVKSLWLGIAFEIVFDLHMQNQGAGDSLRFAALLAQKIDCGMRHFLQGKAHPQQAAIADMAESFPGQMIGRDVIGGGQRPAQRIVSGGHDDFIEAGKAAVAPFVGHGQQIDIAAGDDGVRRLGQTGEMRCRAAADLKVYVGVDDLALDQFGLVRQPRHGIKQLRIPYAAFPVLQRRADALRIEYPDSAAMEFCQIPQQIQHGGERVDANGSMRSGRIAQIQIDGGNVCGNEHGFQGNDAANPAAAYFGFDGIVEYDDGFDSHAFAEFAGEIEQRKAVGTLMKAGYQQHGPVQGIVRRHVAGIGQEHPEPVMPGVAGLDAAAQDPIGGGKRHSGRLGNLFKRHVPGLLGTVAHTAPVAKIRRSSLFRHYIGISGKCQVHSLFSHIFLSYFVTLVK
ncbi:hypothetical protein SDC9_96675 [bioreactor metagenome]|uniref:Uncharacterized protein n=1 Tax=bioreactor metagenome TaxID=1076179 RepID=A0A645ACD9_9ZZZZ